MKKLLAALLMLLLAVTGSAHATGWVVKLTFSDLPAGTLLICRPGFDWDTTEQEGCMGSCTGLPNPQSRLTEMFYIEQEEAELECDVEPDVYATEVVVCLSQGLPPLLCGDDPEVPCVYRIYSNNGSNCYQIIPCEGTSP